MSTKFVVYGEPASKANSRKLVSFKRKGGGSRPAFIKSEKARNYNELFQQQCPRLSPLIEGDVSVTITIYYASRRPDLDESVILDAMQGFVYLNDRQVKEKHIFWGLDKERPRAEIIVEQL
jgi:Holliday junction resolvase RusA-like endonuclease